MKIYIGFSILTFILTFMRAYTISKQLKRKYPDIINEFSKKNKVDTLENIFVWIRLLVACFVPIINICIFYVSIFESERVEKKVLNKLKKDCEEYNNG